ncbi:hypothetical protein MLD38_039660 [Melastoma candidum]|uniref:Uncharacterized protein n=1 Tax=Melastoma candidum TaxID=119954 RepID=A0ACB9L3I9_9MYRT|nr:hypothetical protein MLD38_039660 [Melastoma candidum]
MNPEKSSTRERIIQLPIQMQREIQISPPTIFMPQNTIAKREGSNGSSVSRVLPSVPAPEKKLTLFALRLAILEKAATGLGTLGFIWATVVLLGGFAITLDKTDFWFITIILLIEGTRIFSRSHELEWQHQTTGTIADAGINSFRALKSSSKAVFDTVKDVCSPLSVPRKQDHEDRKISEKVADWRSIIERDLKRKPTRKWASSEVPLLPYAGWVFVSRNISKLFYWLQLSSAVSCVTLSLIKLIKRDFGEVLTSETDKRNRNSALLIFYALALAEALCFLTEKAYWEWTVVIRKLLQEVNKECDFGTAGMISVRRFFYDSYSRSITGSIFHGLEMDMVTFGMELLRSNSPDEQLIGSRILCSFTKNESYSADTLQKIGTTLPVIERLVDMLNWGDPQEEEIRLSAAVILANLARKQQNSLRITGVPGVMESISSLLQMNRSSDFAMDQINEKRIVPEHANYESWTFNLQGLLILKRLAGDHENCGKIGNTRGLLPKIVEFTHAEERTLKDDNVAPSQIETVKRSLEVLKMLASTTGTTGKQLRREISEIVFTISNIKDILQHGGRRVELQKLGIDILTCLALEEDATERIGGTGGVLKELFNIFFREGMPDDEKHVRVAAGEALAMLAFESTSNCCRILRLEVLERLVGGLQIPLLRVNCARILRNLCRYSGNESFNHLKGVTSAAPTVIRAIMTEKDKLQEVMVGLAAQAFKFLTAQESAIIFQRAGYGETDLSRALIEILRRYNNPNVRVPSIRRFAIELSIWMMKDKEKNVQVFRFLKLEDDLKNVLETTSELERFHIFSGSIGLSTHSVTIHSLVDSALALL